MNLSHPDPLLVTPGMYLIWEGAAPYQELLL
jgi:hypothetical protein